MTTGPNSNQLKRIPSNQKSLYGICNHDRRSELFDHGNTDIYIYIYILCHFKPFLKIPNSFQDIPILISWNMTKIHLI